ncbi:MAG TPA: transposase [Gammaproteobacteria bacterium]|nr:transposase [Gammaproteobacteria bacterium]
MATIYREDFKKEIVDLYTFGFSYNELQEMTGIRRETIRNWVREFNQDSRPTGQPKKLEITETYEEIARLRNEEKLSWREIGEKVGCSESAARHRYNSYRSAL